VSGANCATACDPGEYGALDATSFDREVASSHYISRPDRHVRTLKPTALFDTELCAVLDLPVRHTSMSAVNSRYYSNSLPILYKRVLDNDMITLVFFSGENKYECGMKDSDSTDNRRTDRGQMADDLPSFVSLSGHFYRGEMDRAVTWRQRLDQTTHWAVIVIAALLTWVFSNQTRPHYILIIGMLLLFVFLLIEAHRYRGYDVWRQRIRFLQEHLFADLYAPGDGNRSWEAQFGGALRNPSYNVPYWQACAHRLRRVYLALFVVLLVAWVVRITVFVADAPWYRTAAISGIPGPVVVTGIGIGYAVIVGVALWSHRSTPREFRE
jgi:uncharacterized membrane protein